MISYQAAVESLYALGHELHPVRKFDLAHMRLLCGALGDPQRRFPAVLIAGTNGKGSTAATLASILEASGHRTGLYTSPHLVRINERIVVHGEPIPDDAFAEIYERVTTIAAELVAESKLPHRPSFFETMTAIAFVYFAAAGVDIAVLEVGMGGRLDATNVVEPILCVITDIDLDHQKFLGNSIAEVAAEKAGILRAGVPAVTLPQHPHANQVLGERMIAVGARPVSATRNVAAVSPQDSAPVSPSLPRTGRDDASFTENISGVEMRFPLSVLGKEVEIASPLVGRHQLRNLALAITAAEELSASEFRITAESIARGVRQTRWPGRLQRFAANDSHNEVVVDVAHNPAGAWALRSALSEQYEGRPLVLLFAAMADKAIGEMASILWPQMAHVVLTQVKENPRAALPSDLARIAESIGVEHSVAADVAQGVEMAFSEARMRGPDAVVVVAGSIYLAGEVLPILT
jgi:dihydrofolate synthase / folylpolyglutamate synthase